MLILINKEKGSILIGVDNKDNFGAIEPFAKWKTIGQRFFELYQDLSKSWRKETMMENFSKNNRTKVFERKSDKTQVGRYYDEYMRR